MIRRVRSDRDVSTSFSFVGFSLFFILFFTNQMNFRSSETLGGEGIDLQILVRLGVLAGVFAFCLLYYKSFINLLRQIPAFCHALLLVYFLVVTLFPDNFGFYALYALGTHFAMFFIMCVMVSRYGPQNVIYYYFVGVVIFSIVSLVFYYGYPDIGRYTYWNNGKVFVSPRMTGIAGHPNTMGFMTACAVLSFIHLFFKRYPMGKLAFLGLVIVVTCLVLTNSRTSLAGTLLMTSVYAALHYRLFLVAMLCAGLGGLLVFLSIALELEVLQGVLKLVSRSGDVEEITSLTGRSHIWEQLFVMIEKNPVFGWGHGNMSTVLYEHKSEIGFTVAQAHNIYLQILFSGGFIGLFLYFINLIAAMTPALFKIVKQNRSAFEICILLSFILNGITETTMLSNVSNNAYLVFTMCVATLSVFCDDERQKLIEPISSPYQENNHVITE